jgi:putative ABC transport system permease protein
LHDGTYQPVTVLGLDDSSLVGRPNLREGHIEDIFAENGFIVVKDEEFPKLENPKLGTEFELNDHRGVIVGIATVATGALYGMPTLYTTYNRAIQYKGTKQIGGRIALSALTHQDKSGLRLYGCASLSG